jgi:hypothetical protein
MYRFLVRAQIDDAIGDDGIGKVIRQIRLREIADHELYQIRQAYLCNRLRRALNHWLCEIHADDFPSRSYPASGENHIYARTAPQIHDHLPARRSAKLTGLPQSLESLTTSSGTDAKSSGV